MQVAQHRRGLVRMKAHEDRICGRPLRVALTQPAAGVPEGDCLLNQMTDAPPCPPNAGAILPGTNLKATPHVLSSASQEPTDGKQAGAAAAATAGHVHMRHGIHLDSPRRPGAHVIRRSAPRRCRANHRRISRIAGTPDPHYRPRCPHTRHRIRSIERTLEHVPLRRMTRTTTPQSVPQTSQRLRHTPESRPR